MPYELPEQGGGNSDIVVEAQGDGTAENPYNVAAANQIAAALEKSSTSASYLSEEVYVKGKIVSITDTELSSYGNITYYISDDGTTTGQLEVYRGMSFNGAKFKTINDISIGDEVVLKGKLQNWLGTLEFTQGSSLVTVNGEGTSTPDSGSTVDPKGKGTESDPFNVAAAIKKAQETGETETSTEYYIKGIVASNNTTQATIDQYGNMTFTMVDEGTSSPTFTAFQVYGPGKEKFTSTDQIKEGQTVVVCGKIVNYKGNTPETVGKGASYVVSIDGEGTSTGGNNEDDEKTGGTITENSITLLPSTMGLENAQEIGTYELEDGTILIFNSGGNSNAPKYYNSGNNIRMYPKNSVTITAKKKIASLFFDCDTYQGTLCNAGGQVNVSNGTVSTNKISILFDDVNNTETTITNVNESTGAASQIRIIKLVINYAE